jgi:WD40 repeat protein
MESHQYHMALNDCYLRFSLTDAQRRWLIIATWLCAMLAFTGISIADQSLSGYAQSIAQSQSDLDAGRIAEALERLESTDPDLRGFEYEYLLARGNAATGQTPAPDLIRTIPTPDVDTRYGVLDKVKRQVAFICRDGTARIHDLKSPQAEPKLAAHQDAGPIWTGAFSADGTRFFAGYQNGDVVVWDASMWATQHVISISNNKPVREIAASPDGSAFVAEGESALELWSLAGDQPQKIADVGPRYNFGEGLAFSPQGDMIATGGMFDILLHSATTGEEVKTLRHASYTIGLEFSPDGKRLASAPRGNVNKMLAIFDIASGGPLFNVGPLEKHIDGLAFTPDGKRIIATGAQRSVRVFDAQSGTLLLNLDRATRTVNPEVSSDGRVLGWFEATGYRYIALETASNAGE